MLENKETEGQANGESPGEASRATESESGPEVDTPLNRSPSRLVDALNDEPELNRGFPSMNPEIISLPPSPLPSPASSPRAGQSEAGGYSSNQFTCVC